ncbi:MAG: hypothetical protein KDC66_04400 [Phaeodactylibacter sp.]|nr:hypothetical protein [Phaeodactylibacter sp.]MCB9273990.1 hypothetical protein [Lewinellaceae bacterium]
MTETTHSVPPIFVVLSYPVILNPLQISVMSKQHLFNPVLPFLPNQKIIVEDLVVN